jgi:DNA polymerase-3 subunit alpha
MQNEAESDQISLFGDDELEQMPEPVPPTLEPWTALYALSKEKEVVGIYISGHPLDDYKYEIRSFCSAELSELNDLESLSKTEIKVAGIITFHHAVATCDSDKPIVSTHFFHLCTKLLRMPEIVGVQKCD